MSGALFDNEMVRKSTKDNIAWRGIGFCKWLGEGSRWVDSEREVTEGGGVLVQLSSCGILCEGLALHREL